MDRKPVRKNKINHLKKFGVIGGLSLLVIILLWAFSSQPEGRVQQIALNNVVTSSVFKGEFENSLDIRARVLPRNTVYLDITSGGRVEAKFVEQGEDVKKGDPLVQLSNVNLQLDVISREAQISEQLNFLRNTQMNSETNRLDLRRELIENEYQIKRIKRLLKRANSLGDAGALAEDEVQSLEEDLEYFSQLKEVNTARQKQEANIREIQIKQLQDTAERLQDNLKFARENLNALLIKAPVDGHLSSFDAEIGESKEQGARIGQIDIAGLFKVVAQVDEFYLSQLLVGMKAQVMWNNKIYISQIDKVDSRVKNGSFQVELYLPAELNDVTRGQSLEVSIFLSDKSTNTLLIERGAFLNSTGGNWIFVLNEDKTGAVKTKIRIGNKTERYMEVLSGLKEGDKVIVSSYSNFDKADYLKLSD